MSTRNLHTNAIRDGRNKRKGRRIFDLSEQINGTLIKPISPLVEHWIRGTRCSLTIAFGPRVEYTCGIQMGFPTHLLVQVKSLLVEYIGLLIVPLIAIDIRQKRQALRNI